MAKQADQTQDKQEDEIKDADQEAVEAAEALSAKEDAEATAKATKASEAFDKKLDASEEPAEDDIPASGDEPGSDETDPAAKKTAAKAPKSDEAGDEEDSAGVEDEEGQEADAKDGDTSESTISEELAQRGRDAGFTDEEMGIYTSAADLEHTLNILTDFVNERDVQDTRAQLPAQTPGKEADVKDNGFEPEFKNEDDIDPEILANFKGMQKHTEDQAKEITKLREQVGAYTQDLQQQEWGRFIVRFDDMIEKTELVSTFGTGPADKLSQRSAANRNRIAVRKEMLALGQAKKDAGRKPKSEQELFDLAMYSLYPKQVKSIASKKVQTKGSIRIKGAAVGKPASRRTGSLTPDQKALQTNLDFDKLIEISED